MNENEHLPEPADFESDDDEESGAPDYYYCLCCGHSCADDPGGWGCPKCGAIMEGDYF